MVSGSCSDEVSSPIPPARLWKAAIVDSHNLIPKIAPQHIESIVFLEGNGGVGSVKEYKFTDAVKEFSYMRNRIDAIEEKDFVYKYSVVGGGMDDKYESTSFEIKFEPSSSGGSICKISGEYNTKGNYVPSEEEKQKAREGMIKMFRGIEAYLLANPDAYA